MFLRGVEDALAKMLAFYISSTALLCLHTVAKFLKGVYNGNQNRTRHRDEWQKL